MSEFVVIGFLDDDFNLYEMELSSLISISLTVKTVEHISKCLIAVYISCFEKILFNYIDSLCLVVVFLFTFSFISSL